MINMDEQKMKDFLYGRDFCDVNYFNSKIIQIESLFCNHIINHFF